MSSSPTPSRTRAVLVLALIAATLAACSQETGAPAAEAQSQPAPVDGAEDGGASY